MKKIKLFYYEISVSPQAKSIDEILQQVNATSLEARTIKCGLQDIRLEAIEKKTIKNGTQYFWLLRFSRLRDDNWPGVASATSIARDLELEDDELLSEETSLLIDSTNNKMTIQYNHFGVRAMKIQEYLCNFSSQPNGYSFLPILNKDALEKFQKKQILTSIDATIDGITEADIALFNGTSIQDAIQKSVEVKSTRLRISFSVDGRIKSNSLNRTVFDTLIDRLLGRNSFNDKLEVGVKADEQETVERLQLLESLKSSEYNSDEIGRTTGRRYNVDDLNLLLLHVVIAT